MKKKKHANIQENAHNMAKNSERGKRRTDYLMHGKDEIVWKQPKTSEYTEHQKAVVKGEIPLSDVHTNALISIHQKAKMLGDIELSERIFDLIMDRRTAQRDRWLAN